MPLARSSDGSESPLVPCRPDRGHTRSGVPPSLVAPATVSNTPNISCGSGRRRSIRIRPVCHRGSDPGGWPDRWGRRRHGDRMGRTRWGTGSGHRLLCNQSTHSADNRHNGWDCWCKHVDRHDCRVGNKRSRNTLSQRNPPGLSGHRNGRLRAGSPDVGHRDHKRNTRRPDWRPPPPACSRAGPGRTGAAGRRHTVPDGPQLSGGVPRPLAVGVGTIQHWVRVPLL